MCGPVDGLVPYTHTHTHTNTQTRTYILACTHVHNYAQTHTHTDIQNDLHTCYLFHSRLSFAMNLKMISPKEIVSSVLSYYRMKSDEITISQVEGFIRQVIGWREYMRGMYWAHMPNYKNLNTLDNHHSIPDFFWTGNTQMNCLSKTINNSLDNAYAHQLRRICAINSNVK